jgi:hypothetical protein
VNFVIPGRLELHIVGVKGRCPNQLNEGTMAGMTGLEPAIFGVTGRRLAQLDYIPMEAGARIELTCIWV